MDGNLFFVLGIVLVIAAVLVAFGGIRGKDSFPASRPLMLGVAVVFVGLVAATMAFAVVKANHEQKDREDELAQEEEQAAPPANPGGQPQASGGGNQQAPEQGSATTLDVSSPQDGSLVFDPDGLQAEPGNLTVNYTNPSPVPHSFALATADGNVLDQTDEFAGGEQSISVTSLAPGKYVFFCTVPGHRQAGMEGNLTVGAGGATSGQP
jgi:plastocyanin